MTTCSMSVNLEQTDGKEGTDGEMIEPPPPQPGKTKDPNCATAVAAPSLSISRRVKFPISLDFKMHSTEQRWDRLPGRPLVGQPQTTSIPDTLAIVLGSTVYPEVICSAGVLVEAPSLLSEPHKTCDFPHHLNLDEHCCRRDRQGYNIGDHANAPGHSGANLPYAVGAQVTLVPHHVRRRLGCGIVAVTRRSRRRLPLGKQAQSGRIRRKHYVHFSGPHSGGRGKYEFRSQLSAHLPGLCGYPRGSSPCPQCFACAFPR